MSDTELTELVAFACELADKASEVTLKYFRQFVDDKLVDNKLGDGQFDPVTIADRDAEARMRAAIGARYPDHGVLGEEHGIKTGTTKLTWVLDPIDGTRSFISGIPLWGTLIALFDGTKPVLGVMDQPFIGERFISDGSKSFYLHKDIKKTLLTRDCAGLANATLMSTAPDMFDSLEAQAHQQLESRVKLTRYGADCYAYGMLASGQIDLVVESGLGPYDIQALIPIVESAGGVVTDWQGGSAVNGGQIIAAATKSLHAQALVLLEPAARKSEIIL